MRLKNFALVTIYCLILSKMTYSQELNCDVRIDYSKVSGADIAYFRDLERAIESFLNDRAWTQLQVKPHERIRCQISLQIQEINGNQIRAQAIIQAERPVFNSTYTTPLFAYRDQNWTFTYNQGEQLIFAEGAYTGELTALLTFYAYFIIGMDMNSFGYMGGIPFLQKAYEVASIAHSNTGNESWGPADKKRENRYWLVAWILQYEQEDFLKAYYEYHRLALDIAHADLAGCIQRAYNALQTLQRVHQQYPSHMGVRVFIEAKRNELINMFSGASYDIRRKAYQILLRIDPAHRDEYRVLLQP